MENLPLDDLYKMLQQHKLHMKFLKDNDMMTDDRKLKIVEKVEYISHIIEGSSSQTERGIMMKVFLLVVVAAK